jgi:transcriptional regulator with XRE-family HTH domain
MSKLAQVLSKARTSVAYLTETIVLDLTCEIERLMKARKISRADLAKKVDVSPAYITKILRGEGNLTIKTVVSLADAVGAKVVLQLIEKEHSENSGEWRDFGMASPRHWVMPPAANESFEPCQQAA